ncbi:hypothetical protein B0H12DRAFT_1080909 [Mycena haematopus]|nr:hypothetical protein B0H12DRAFT_1080909 [Mycena haematopus]
MAERWKQEEHDDAEMQPAETAERPHETGNRRCELEARKMKSDFKQECEAGNGRRNSAKIGRKGEGKDNTIVRAGNRPRRLHRPCANRKSEMRTAERNMESDLNQEFEANMAVRIPPKLGRKGEGKEHPIVQAGDRPNRQRRPHGTRKSEMRSCDRKMKSDFKESFPPEMSGKISRKKAGRRRMVETMNPARRPAEAAEVAAARPEMRDAESRKEE